VQPYHANARLTARGRRALLEAVGGGTTVVAACAGAGVSRTTYDRWRRRYVAAGEPGLADRSSRPRRSPQRLAPEREAEVARLRRERGWGPDRIAAALGVARSTAHRAIRRMGLQRPRPVPPPVTRFEHATAGAMLHVDSKKLGRIARGPGHRATGDRSSRARGAGWTVLFAAVDDATRLAYAELLPDETGATAAGFLRRAHAHFAAHGAAPERVLTDNGAPFRSGAWAAACAELGTRHARTRPSRPQTNGKVERWLRTVLAECLDLLPLASEAERTLALERFLRSDNAERPHLALRGRTPLQRLASAA